MSQEHPDNSNDQNEENSEMNSGYPEEVRSEEEMHLPHEAWHVVQQKQGRRRPNISSSEEETPDEE